MENGTNPFPRSVSIFLEGDAWIEKGKDSITSEEQNLTRAGYGKCLL
jgi:hypothetical protein